MVVVAELVVGDIPLFSDFLLEAWRLAGSSAFGWVGATKESMAEITSEPFLRKLVTNPNIKVFAVKANGKVVGACVLRKIDEQLVELAGIMVRQDLLGKGIGSALFESAKCAAVNYGFNTIFVKTEGYNQTALRFYRKKGFVEQRRGAEELGGNRVELVVLKLDL